MGIIEPGQSAGGSIAKPAVVSVAAGVGALVYLPIAVEVHVYGNQVVDFPALAIPWLVLVFIGLRAGLSAIGERPASALHRRLAWAGLAIAAIQVVAGTAFAIYGLLNINWMPL